MNKIIIINSETMGQGNQELGKTLIGSFLRKLMPVAAKPSAIVFYNSGVKLLNTESEVLDALGALFQAGVDLVACGTCVKFYEQSAKMAIGRVGTMEEIAALMLSAGSVVTI